MLSLYHRAGSPSSRVLHLWFELRAVYQRAQQSEQRARGKAQTALPPPLVLYEFEEEQEAVSKEEWFVQDAPNGEVPLLLDRGVALWDSCAICTYLLDTYDPLGLLLPRAHDTKLGYPAKATPGHSALFSSAARAMYHQICAVCTQALDHEALDLERWHTIYGPWLERMLEERAGQRRTVSVLFDTLEVRNTGHRPYLLGAGYSALDMVLCYALNKLDSGGGGQRLGQTRGSTFLCRLRYPLLCDYKARISRSDAWNRSIITSKQWAELNLPSVPGLICCKAQPQCPLQPWSHGQWIQFDD